MHLDHERCLRAVRAKDTRFDGWFFTAVRTTGIYCRPSCPATPAAANVSFYPSAAAAQRAGYRACKRCRPDASPGSPEWDNRADVVARAMRLIADGVVDRRGVSGLARHLGYSVRQVERHLLAELGAGPVALARANRAQTARILLETTTLPLSEVAFAAGFGSVRSFNDTVRAVFALPPGELRRRVRSSPTPAPPVSGAVSLRLPFRTPLASDSLFGHLAARAVPGMEEWRDGAYRRTLRLPLGHGIVELRPREGHVYCRLRLTDMRDLTAAVARSRRLLDLDADPMAVDQQLGQDRRLGPLVAAAPGRRVPGSVDAEELAVRAIIGQHVSTAAARTKVASLVADYGEAVDDPDGELTSMFPAASTLAALDPGAMPMPWSRGAAVRGLAIELTEGRLDLGPGADRARARADLLAVRGIGPWTVEIIAMRGLGDPDAFPGTDLGVRRASEKLEIAASSPALSACAESWRPWRAYAVQHLWTAFLRDGHRQPLSGAGAAGDPYAEER